MKRYKHIRRISENQYVVYRRPRSGKLTKFRRGIKLIAEVRNKKSHKIMGYLNKIEKKGKKKKPIARKIGRVERSRKTKKRILRLEQTSEREFKINFSQLLISQVKTVGKSAIKFIQREIDLNDEAPIQVETETISLGIFRDGFTNYGSQDNDFDFLATDVAIRIIQMLREQAIRTSPVKFQKSKRIKTRKMPRTAMVRVQLGRLK